MGMQSKWSSRWIVALALSAMVTAGCRNLYYAAWEKLGKEKRDLLKDNIQDVRQDQQAAREQFKDALTQLKELYGFSGGELEEKYTKLKDEYDDAASKAATVRSRIEKVDSIAADLFKEWQTEIESMSNETLKSASRRELRDTQRKFESLNAAMSKAERSMEPVLTQLHDHVLYLKHNLNAQAVGALKGEADDIEKEINKLITDMNTAISEADDFIKTLQ